MAEQIASTLRALEKLQRQHELTLLKLGEPLFEQEDKQQNQQVHTDGQRTSDASSTADQNGSYPTAASLSADLTHYRDLFTKLRFSYTEQVTKEKFLRYLVSSPPPPVEHVSPAANAELEFQLAEIKDTLKQQKQAVNERLAAIEAHARELAGRHQQIEAQAQELRELPTVIDRLKKDIEEMRSEQGIGGEAGDGQAELGMSLEATVSLVEEKETQLDRVTERLEQVDEQKARKVKELRRLEEEVASAEGERDRAVKGAEDARKRRKAGKGGIGDEVEARGRWLRGVENTMRGLLEVET